MNAAAICSNDLAVLAFIQTSCMVKALRFSMLSAYKMREMEVAILKRSQSSKFECVKRISEYAFLQVH